MVGTGCESSSCLTANAAGVGGSESVSFSGTRNARYYIAVVGFGTGGPFTLLVE